MPIFHVSFTIKQNDKDKHPSRGENYYAAPVKAFGIKDAGKGRNSHSNDEGL